MMEQILKIENSCIAQMLQIKFSIKRHEIKYLEGATCLHDHWFLQRDLGGLGGDGLPTLVRINNLEISIWCLYYDARLQVLLSYEIIHFDRKLWSLRLACKHQSILIPLSPSTYEVLIWCQVLVSSEELQSSWEGGGRPPQLACSTTTGWQMLFET